LGEVPILLVSPEMALGGARGALQEAAIRKATNVSGGHLVAVVIDEAHVIASWGRHFRPDFQRLSGFVRELRQQQPELRTLLLSATINDSLRKRLTEDFAGTGLADEVVVAEPRNEFDIVWQYIAPNIDRQELLVRAVDVIPRPTIIYTTTVEDAEGVHERLRERGYSRLALFTGSIDDPSERQQILDAWAQGDTDIVVATSAFGMGVDKPDVRAVVHACVPESADRLYQEIGRAGRDGHQALSLCLWTDGDAATAADLAIHGWMRPETSVRRWKAILREVSQKKLLGHSPSGSLIMKIPLDARHDLLEKITGQLNRQWNSALLTLLQRCNALRIVGEEATQSGAKLWVAEILRPAIVEDGSALEASLAMNLTVGEKEARNARQSASELENRLRNTSERCFREALFDLVEPAGSPWPCGRCDVCIEAGESPHQEPSRSELHTAWPSRPWNRPNGLKGGAVVVNPEDPTFAKHFDRLICYLSAAGIEQFVTTRETIGVLEKNVTSTNPDLGFTLLLGGPVPISRVPTAVLLGSAVSDPESVRKHCIALRMQFEKEWPELPLLFVLSPDILGVGALLAQHLSSHAPMAEQELTGFRSGS
jgi:ATP-dependent DNA helicase RecQ